MPDFVFSLTCPNCGGVVTVPFGRRADDSNVVAWRHDGCPSASTQGRCTDVAFTSLPTDDDGNLLPPA